MTQETNQKKMKTDSPEDIRKLYRQSVIKTWKDRILSERDRPSLIMHQYHEAEELPI